MQALILAGGEGSRLRPLTLTSPKPAMTLVDRPFIAFMIDWVSRHGVTDVVIACGFGAAVVRDVLGTDHAAVDRITYVEEDEPLGTAGPLRLAADQGLLDERFLVLNGDLLTDLDLSALLASHSERHAAVTLALHRVADPTAYGLVRRDRGPAAPGADPVASDGEVLGFLEKPNPAEIDTDEVNAGAYVVERDVVDLIPAERMCSIEREIFPRLVGHGLYARRLEGYWMDVGTPERYLEASWDILERTVKTDVRVDDSGLSVADGARLDAGAVVEPPALVCDQVSVGSGAAIGARAVIGRATVIGDHARVTGSVLLSDCTVGSEAEIREAILASGVAVGAGATIGAGSVVGAGARIEAGAELQPGARVQPGAVAA